MTVKDSADRVSTLATDKLAAVGDKLHGAADHLQDAAGAARSSASETLGLARDKIATVYDTAVQKSAAAYDAGRDYTAVAADAARDKANAVIETAKESAASAKARTGDGIDSSPLVALLGGIAAGVLIGALLPRTEREAQALGPVSEKLGLLAKNALSAAKEAGRETLDEMGLNKDNAREQVKSLFTSATKAAASAGAAAAETVRTPQA